MSSVTLRDVADAAGVHPSTASRALNASTRSVVNPVTVERVVAAAELLGYRPDPLARGLRTSRTLSIGVVIPDHENPIFGPIVAGLEGGLSDDGYSVLITAAKNGREDPAVRSLLDRRVDGLILASASRVDPVAERLAERGTPTVLVNRRAENVSLPAIVGDDQLGVRQVVDHLVELGHSAIGHIAGPGDMSTGHSRRLAFENAMSGYGLRVVVEEGGSFQVEPGARATARLLEREPSLTAIVAANDLLGLGAYRTIRATGRRVGADVAVTGYNDVAMLDLMEPPMTAVRVGFREMGTRAAEAMLELLGGGPQPETEFLETALSIRASTVPSAEITSIDSDGRPTPSVVRGD